MSRGLDARRAAALAALRERIRGCRRCPTMGERGGVPGTGTIDARLLLVGEAPGRLGCGHTGIPFVGDRSGENLDRLLGETGLRREEVFVTNAVHCLPLDRRARNRPPSAREMEACRPHLEATLEIVRPKVVATLGRVAWRTLAPAGNARAPLAEAVGRPLPRDGGILFPLYHPSPRVAAATRPLEAQRRDWRALAVALRRREALSRARRARPSP